MTTDALATSAISKDLFEDDDQETLDLLISGHVDTPKYLDGLATRFHQDVVENNFWETLVQSVQELGFAVSSILQDTSSNTPPPTQLPVAFETDSGKQHVQATCRLLRVSETRAVQLTLSALRILGKQEDAHIQSLLGTRNLLRQVRDYYYQQRILRLKVITECLRVEQDETSALHDAAHLFLNDVDKEFSMENRVRGLFRRLLTVACAPYAPLSRDELVPTLKLRSPEDAQLPANLSSDTFVADCIRASKQQTLREREEAMEAMLVLLYSRIDQGIQRVDYALLLVAFKACNFFTTQATDRLPLLAGLVCAECCSLCLTTGNGNNWVTTHPLLLGVTESDHKALQEMDALRVLVLNCENQVKGPESIALLSFALLLKLSGRFDQVAMECAQMAGDYGAFDYLDKIVSKLVPRTMEETFSSCTNASYDWLLSNDTSTLILESPSEQDDLSAAAIAYTSIALEVLSCTIVAFQDTIMTGTSVSTENVGMLCGLAATIYRNCGIFCQNFWSNMETYKSGNSLNTSHAICFLLDAAHADAAAALKLAFAAIQGQPGLEEHILPLLVPLLQLASSLCSNSELMESVLSLFPQGLIRTVLLCCAPQGAVANGESFTKTVAQALEAVQRLAKVGNRTKLCHALEQDTGAVMDGPRVLYRILVAHQDPNILGSPLSILGYLTTSIGNEVWVAKTMYYFGQLDLRAFLTGQNDFVTLSTLHVLNGFVTNLSTVAFCAQIKEGEIVEAIKIVLEGISVACTTLSSLLSPSSRRGNMYRIAHGVLRAVSVFLRQVRPIMNLHSSLQIRAAAREARNVVIQGLATSTVMGQAVSYFASAPVSLTLVVALEGALRKFTVLQLASDEHAREEEPKAFGAWRSVMRDSSKSESVSGIAQVRELAEMLVSNIQDLDVDIAKFQDRGWTGEGSVNEPVQAAFAALDLLRLWALHVDEMVADSDEEKSLASDELRVLSPYPLLFRRAVKPPEIEMNDALAKVWPSDKLSLFDLLLRYQHGSGEQLPNLIAAGVLSLSLEHAKRAESGQATRNLVVELLISRKTVLLGSMVESIQSASQVSSAQGANGALSSQQKDVLRRGLASLRLLKVCMDFDPLVAMSFCDSSNGSTLLDTVTGMVQAYSESIKGMVPQAGLLASKARIADGTLGVLLSIWKATCDPSTIPGDSSISDAINTLKKVVVADLVGIISQLSTLPSPGESRSNMYLRSVIFGLKSKALEILQVALGTKPEGPNDEMRNLMKPLMSDSFSSLSDSFSRMDGAVAAARSSSKTMEFFKPFKNVSFKEQKSVLKSFPVVYQSHIGSDELEGGSLCDIAAALSWLLSPHRTTDSSEAANLLENANASQFLVSNQLSLMSSWGRFALMYSSADEQGRNQANGGAAAEKTLTMARAVMNGLNNVASDLEQAQMNFSDNFMSLPGGRAAYVLAGLLFEMMNTFFQELSTGTTTMRHDTAKQSLVKMLEQLSKTGDMLFSVTYPFRLGGNERSGTVFAGPLRTNHNVELQRESLRTCCALQQRLMSVAMLCTMALDLVCSKAQPSMVAERDENRLSEILLEFVAVACKGLTLARTLSSSSSRSKDQLCRELLLTSVSMLTVLLSNQRSSASTITGDSVYFSNAAALLKQNNVTESLVTHADVASKLACSTAQKSSGSSNNRSEQETLFIADENEVRIVQSIFTLVRTIAEMGKKSADSLATLSSSVLSRMIVDNPLLIAAGHYWISLKRGDGHFSGGSLILRGYLPLKDKIPIDMPTGESKTVAAGPFLSGRDDPVHGVWRTALKIFEVVVHASGSADTSNGANDGFLETAMDFLKAHSSSLLGCLEQCAFPPFDNRHGISSTATHTVLTFNVLGEASDILSLVSALCRGARLHRFENADSNIYQEMNKAAHAVLSGLSKFLGAAGTARETFAALKEYDLRLQDNTNQEQNDFRYGFAERDNIHPLLQGGIPNANHEAIKHAHFASRCCAFVTSADYEGFPTAAARAVASPRSTSSLAEDCQLSMNSPFMIKMEHIAAECVFQAVLILSETHPANTCFVMFSPDEVKSMDLLPHLQPAERGVVVAVRPSQTNARFCRIQEVDTVRRQCHVRGLDEGPDGAVESVPVEEIVGLEDASKRRPILNFSAAPDSSSDLGASAAGTIGDKASLGDLIVALRWCYQHEGTGTEFLQSRTVRNALAERASTLLGTEISLHGEKGTASKSNSNESSKLVLAQLLQLFDDTPVGVGEVPGRSLKTIIGPPVWLCIQQQLQKELTLARKDRTEKLLQMEKRRNEINISSPFFHPSRQQGGGTSFQTGFAPTAF